MSTVLLRSRRLFPLISRRISCSRMDPLHSFCSQAEKTMPEALNAPQKKSSFSFLKFGLVSTLLGVSTAAGYATYEYSADEIEEKTRDLRSLARNVVVQDGSFLKTIQAAMYAFALEVPAKAVELYLDLRRTIEEQVRGVSDPVFDKLLPDMDPQEQGAFTLVLDLNETLVYSDWKRERGWRTFKRPGVDAFLQHLSKYYEIVVYSDQLGMYVDPIVGRLNETCGGCIRYGLNRSATKYQNGKHYRDLSKLNRDPSRVIYISAHALETSLQPENSVQIKPWTTETDDTDLVDLIPFLEYIATHRPHDIRPVLTSYHGKDVGKEFIRRSVEYQRNMQEQKQHKRAWWR